MVYNNVYRVAKIKRKELLPDIFGRNFRATVSKRLHKKILSVGY